MTRRAWWLVVLNFLIPGSAQSLAGSRKLGRFGLATTLVFWLIILISILFWVFARSATLAIVANSTFLFVFAIVLAIYAVIWVLFSLDTLRIVKLARARPTSRLWIALFSIIAMLGATIPAAYGSYLVGNVSSFIAKV